MPAAEAVPLVFTTFAFTSPLLTQPSKVAASLTTEPTSPATLALASLVRVKVALFVTFLKIPPFALQANAPTVFAYVEMSEVLKAIVPFILRSLISLCLPAPPPGSSLKSGLLVVTVYPHPSRIITDAVFPPPARVVKLTPDAVRSIFAVR